MAPHGRALGPAAARSMTGRPGNVRSPAVYRLAPLPPRSAPRDADSSARTPAVARLEAALFLAEEPLTRKQLAAVSRVPEADVPRLIATLSALLDADGTAFHLVSLAGGYQLLTRPVYHSWLARARRPTPELRLTPTLLETLAAVAYKQPVTRADVESARGTGAGEALRSLVERGLVRPAGRQNTLGRPQLYATTRKFLQLFGLTSLGDLPNADNTSQPPPRPREAAVAG